VYVLSAVSDLPGTRSPAWRGASRLDTAVRLYDCPGLDYLRWCARDQQ